MVEVRVLVKVHKLVKVTKGKKLVTAAESVLVSRVVKCRFIDSEVVTRETLIDKGFLSGINKSMPIKILAKGEFNKALTFKGIEKFSAKALELIKKAGGKVENA